MQEEVLETGGNSTLKKETEDENNEKETTANGNNMAHEQRDKMESPSDINLNIKTEVVIESPPVNAKKDVPESSTQFWKFSVTGVNYYALQALLQALPRVTSFTSVITSVTTRYKLYKRYYKRYHTSR